MREIQQYATIRNGVLPTTSFAGYGVNYVRFVKDNPKPRLVAGNWLAHPKLPEFDYVLLRSPTRAEASSRRVRLVQRDGDWQLFAVCGAQHAPRCD